MDASLKEILAKKGAEISSVCPETSIEEAVEMMNRKRIGAMIIMNGDELVGIFTERDLLNRVIVEKIDLASTPIHKVMTRDLVVVKPSLTVSRAMRVVTEKRLRHLPVVEDGKLMGMISSGDLTRSLAAEGEEMISTLMDYINGTYPG